MLLIHTVKLSHLIFLLNIRVTTYINPDLPNDKLLRVLKRKFITISKFEARLSKEPNDHKIYASTRKR